MAALYRTNCIPNPPYRAFIFTDKVEHIHRSGAEAVRGINMPDVWPAVRTEQSPGDMSTADGLIVGSAIVPTIASREVALEGPVSALVAESSALLASFEAGALRWGLDFRESLLRVESLSSSALDGIERSVRAIAEGEIGAFDSHGAPVARNSKMIRVTMDDPNTFTNPAILALQRILFPLDGDADPDGYRTHQVWLSDGEPVGSAEDLFVPPSFERVPMAMVDLCKFAQRTDIPPLIHAALTHAQFETIHPFFSGNGRIGRALVQHMIRRAGWTSSVVFPISAGLLAQKPQYIAALAAYRAGRIAPIIAVFASAIPRVVANTDSLFLALSETDAEWQQKLGSTRGGATALRLAELAREHPVLHSKYVETRFRIPPKTALGALTRLQDLQILNLATSTVRARLWIAPEITAALTAFAGRSQPPR